MQNLIDLFAAAFVFVLFASVYRKRRTRAVLAWVVGWFFILLHFAVLQCRVHSGALVAVRDVLAPASLVLCALALTCSRNEIWRRGPRGAIPIVLLAVPWLGAVGCAAWRTPSAAAAGVLLCLGALSLLLVAVFWFRQRRPAFAGLILVALASLTWFALLPAAARQDADLVLCVVLTQCFGANAVLLSTARRLWTTGQWVTTLGSVAWAAVWPVALALAAWWSSLTPSPELWNIPKYLVASGMILLLLEEEIRAAAQASERYRLLFAGNPHPMWVYTPDTLEVLEANGAALGQYGYGAEQIKGLPITELFVDRASEELLGKLRGAGLQQLSGPWEQRRRDGSLLTVDMTNQPVVRDGQAIMFSLMADVTERERLHSELVRQAHHDPLTGLFNRAAFEQHYRAELEAALQGGRTIALFCLDLDRFKQVNDTLGHAAGDLVLQEVAERLRRSLGQRGILARYGGDEFVVLFSNLSHSWEAEQLAEQMSQELRQSVQPGSEDLEIACSIGMALCPDDGTEGDQLWRDADAAMYQAKRAGGSQWVRASREITSSAFRAKEIEVHLRRALKAESMELHYQPQFDSHGRLQSVEALFRSTDPVLRALPTDEIIAIAEETSLIIPLGNWVLEQACRQSRAWLEAGLPALQIAVNVSLLQLTRFDFAKQVARLLERYRLNARMLEFEVTESTMMPERSSEAPRQIAALARMGIRFAVDDFGKGYSSLGRLHQLPVHVLKIDKDLTQRMGEAGGTYPTVEAIVALAHTFGMQVCAEGVETEEQRYLLQALQCDRLQGFLLSLPLSSEETTAMLRQSLATEPEEIVA